MVCVVTKRVRKGNAYMTNQWRINAVSELTVTYLDPQEQNVGIQKHCAIRIEQVSDQT